MRSNYSKPRPKHGHVRQIEYIRPVKPAIFVIDDPAPVVFVDNLQYSSDVMVTLRTELNAAKSSMDPIYTRADEDRDYKNRWQRFQMIIDLYGSLKRELAPNVNFVTNAWLKYWEIYSMFPELLPAGGSKIVGFFNAELPGASLTAFNHFMRSRHRDREFEWYASSLVGDSDAKDTTAFGDNYGIWAHNRDRWLMSESNNGDCTLTSNLRDFAARVGPKSPVGGCDLYSHDAGIDVSGIVTETGQLGFNDQELANARLHLGCAIAGFMTLRPDGSFIAKQYTFFETFTWNLILIYATLFEKFMIVKPQTSRPYNSEIYLIGTGFKGLPAEVAEALLARLENFNTNPFLANSAISTLPQVSEIQRAARVIFAMQKNMINQNVRLWGEYHYRLGDLSASLERLSAALRQEWMRVHPVGRINASDQIPSNHTT